MYEYEFDLLGLPRPDLVIYMDIDANVAGRRLLKRQSETGTDRDIHERDALYLKQCVTVGKQAAGFYNWTSVACISNGNELSESELHDTVYDIVLKHLAI